MIKQIFWRGQVFLRLTLPLVTDQLMLVYQPFPAPIQLSDTPVSAAHCDNPHSFCGPLHVSICIIYPDITGMQRTQGT